MTDRYQIIRLIIKDSLGGIYLAKDATLDREVVFRNFDTGQNQRPVSDWEPAYRAFTEKLKALQHPSLLAVFDAAIEDEHPVLITQHIEADTIADTLKNGPLSVKETMRLAIDLLSAMKEAHNVGIFHGAMHTGSVQRLPVAQGEFNHVLNDLGHKHLSSLVSDKEAHLEDPVFTAPELLGNPNAANVQTDLFMIGQLCFTVLAGGHPFAEHSPKKCAQAYRSNKLPALSQFTPNVPAALTSWIKSLSENRPAQRPRSAEDAMRSLQTIASQYSNKANGPSSNPPYTPTPGQPSKKTSRGMILGIISIILIAAGGFFAFSNQNKSKPVAIATHTKAGQASPTENLDSTSATNQSKNNNTKFLPPGPNTPKIIQGRKITAKDSMLKAQSIPIYTKETLDWAIPKDDQVLYNDPSPYKLDISPEKCNVGQAHHTSLMTFSIKKTAAQKNGETVTPALARVHSHNKRAQSWDVSMRPAGDHKGALELVFYLTQKSCSISFEVTFPNQDKILLRSPSKGPGVVEVRLLFPKITPNKEYNIHVQSLPTSKDEEWITGLHGVFLKTQSVASSEKASPPKKAPKKKKKQKRSPQKIVVKPHLPSKGFKPVLQTATNENHFNSPEWFHAEGSIIKLGEGQYYLFYSRWKKEKSVNARITHPEIAIATSTTSSGPWKHVTTAFTGRDKHWDKFGVSHPIIQKFDGEYYLYYVSTSADITPTQLEAAAKAGGSDKNWTTLNNNRCIGVARVKKLGDNWQRLNEPIISAEPPFSDFSCSPSVIKNPDGKYLIMTSSKKGNKTVSNIIQSDEAHFSNPTTIATVPGESFSLWYNTTEKIYQYLQNPNSLNFAFSSLTPSSLKRRTTKHILKKPTTLPAKETSTFKAPSVYLGDDGTPEVLIFHSEDTKNGGIFTIPFKK